MSQPNMYDLAQEEQIDTLIRREKYEEVAIVYLAKAHVHAERNAEQAQVYATIAQAFATLETAKAHWSGT